MKIIVRGTPAPQGSKRHVGHGVMIESSKKVKPWRESVKYAAIEARDGALPLDGPLFVRMVFTFIRPRGHYRSGIHSDKLRADAPTHPKGYPDLSKLARSTEDALTEARIWHDDAQVVEYYLSKVYANEGADALDSLGAVIYVERYA